MAADGTSFFEAKRNMQGITAILMSTACEWFLIFLLLVDAIFSYLLTKFARYCELQLPCILCSRLDHVIGNEKPDFYRNLLCSNHRLEMSSLVSCQIHGKLTDGYAMCDDCLLSFSTKDYSNPDMHRLFLGKLGFDFVGCGSQSSMPNRDFCPMSKKLCSCCNKPLRSRKKLQRLLHVKSPGTRARKPSIPLTCGLSKRDGLKKIRDKKISGPLITDCFIGTSGLDPLSHVRHSEVKITSDSESEFPFSDDDGSTVIHDITEAKDNASKPHDMKYLTPDIWHDLAELNWQQPIEKTYPSLLPELISPDDIPPLPSTPEVSAGLSPICQSVTPSTVESMSLVDMKPSFVVAKFPVGAPPEKSNISGETSTRHFSINHQDEVLKLQNSTSGAGIRNDQVQHSSAPVNLTYQDTSDGCKLAVSSKEEEVAGFVAEKSVDKECDNDATDVKLSADSSSQGINLPTKNLSINAQGCPDQFQKNEATSCNGIETPQKSILVERTESASLETLDGSSVSEIEGESTIDRLKRQVEYDRRCMNALYKELDEERSASAVAANQAMAMITRLQEEKAALNMDALQYLRMMEEQAEYDLDALEKANDLLAEKEKEIQDLEAALECFALKYPEDTMMEDILGDNYVLKKENVNGQNKRLNHIKDITNVNVVSKDKDKPETVMTSWSEIQDERLYIMKSLKSLERKLQTLACDGFEDGYSKAAADGLFNLGKHLDKEGNSVHCRIEKNGLSSQKDLALSNGSIPAQKGLNVSICEDEVASEEKGLVSNRPKYLTHGRKNELVALENEISDLRDRVEAPEDDCNFLEHTFNSLQNGNEGLSFIQEIAHQLQEIRKIEIRCRCRPIP